MPDLYSSLEHKVTKGEISWLEILSEINAIKNERIRDFLPCIRVYADVDLLISENHNQHKIYVRKELWNSLSNDAKQVVYMILSASSNDWRSNRYGKELLYKEKFSHERLYNVMRKRFKWRIRRINKVFDELKQYCNELERIG